MRIEHDLYRTAPVVEAFDVAGPDPQWTLGSLVDDVDSVNGFMASGGQPIAVWHELAHLAGILRALELVDRS